MNAEQLHDRMQDCSQELQSLFLELSNVRAGPDKQPPIAVQPKHTA